MGLIIDGDFTEQVSLDFLQHTPKLIELTIVGANLPSDWYLQDDVKFLRGLQFLRILQIHSNNRPFEVGPNMFPQSLRELRFRYNTIETLHVDAFTGMPNLKKLYLRENN